MRGARNGAAAEAVAVRRNARREVGMAALYPNCPRGSAGGAKKVAPAGHRTDNSARATRLSISTVTPPWNDHDDRRLLRRMADGDREAFGALYDRHAAALFRHALILSRSRTLAEDLVQDVFVKLGGMGADLLGIRSAGAYLHRMLRTAFLDSERHRAVAAEDPLEEGRVTAGAMTDTGAAEADRLALEAALAQLPIEQREAIALHVMEGRTFREVAAATSVTMWTAASRYRLAIERLRIIMRTRDE